MIAQDNQLWLCSNFEILINPAVYETHLISYVAIYLKTTKLTIASYICHIATCGKLSDWLL